MSDFEIPSFSTPVSYTNADAPKKTADAKASKEIMGESFGNTLKGFVEDVNMVVDIFKDKKLPTRRRKWHG